MFHKQSAMVCRMGRHRQTKGPYGSCQWVGGLTACLDPDSEMFQGLCVYQPLVGMHGASSRTIIATNAAEDTTGDSIT